MARSKNIDMTKGPILKELVLFALPLLLGNAFQQLYKSILRNILCVTFIAAKVQCRAEYNISEFVNDPIEFGRIHNHHSHFRYNTKPIIP